MLEPSSKLENSSWSQRSSLSVHSLSHLVTNTLVSWVPGIPQAVAVSEGSLLSLPGCSALQFPIKTLLSSVCSCSRDTTWSPHTSLCCCYRVCKNPASPKIQSTPSDRVAFSLKTKMAIKWLLKGKFKLKCLWKDGSHRKYQLISKAGCSQIQLHPQGRVTSSLQPSKKASQIILCAEVVASALQSSSSSLLYANTPPCFS